MLTFPEAQIVDFNEPGLPDTTLLDTKHYTITKGILEHPQRYRRHLLPDTSSGDEYLDSHAELPTCRWDMRSVALVAPLDGTPTGRSRGAPTR